MVAARIMGDVENMAAARAKDGYKEHSRCKSTGWIENTAAARTMEEYRE
jgi:hypothetical protein